MVAAVRDLADLRTEIRERCDQEGPAKFVTDTTIDSWVQQSAAALLDIILDYAGPDAFTLSVAVPVVAGTAVYDIGTGVYRLLGVDVQFGGRWRALDRASFADRNRWQGGGWTSPSDTRYMLGGRDATTGATQIRFVPEPAAAHSARVWYVPIATTLVAGTKPLVSINGWDEWVVADVCAKILEKEESASKPFLTRRAETQIRIIAAAKQLDSGEPLHMRDVNAESIRLDDEPLWSS